VARRSSLHSQVGRWRRTRHLKDLVHCRRPSRSRRRRHRRGSSAFRRWHDVEDPLMASGTIPVCQVAAGHPPCRQGCRCDPTVASTPSDPWMATAGERTPDHPHSSSNSRTSSTSGDGLFLSAVSSTRLDPLNHPHAAPLPRASKVCHVRPLPRGAASQNGVSAFKRSQTTLTSCACWSACCLREGRAGGPAERSQRFANAVTGPFCTPLSAHDGPESLP
jgi:hypothetical protein